MIIGLLLLMARNLPGVPAGYAYAAAVELLLEAALVGMLLAEGWGG